MTGSSADVTRPQSGKEARGASDWPYADEVLPGRSELQHHLVENDPFFQLLGVTLRRLERDEAVLALPFRKDLVQPTGILHGGLYGVLIDSAIAQALLTTLQPSFSVVTLHLDTKYFAPVTGGEISASARIVRKGKAVAHGEGRVLDAAGNLVAQGWGVFAVKRLA